MLSSAGVAPSGVLWREFDLPWAVATEDTEAMNRNAAAIVQNFLHIVPSPSCPPSNSNYYFTIHAYLSAPRHRPLTIL
jgi:hypothetical protein